MMVANIHKEETGENNKPQLLQSNYVKGISNLIGFVMIILITVSSISIVLVIGIPIIDQAKERGVLNEAKQNLQVIDNSIKVMVSEGTGTLRTIQLRITEGEYRIDPDSNSVSFELDISSETIPKGTIVREGNIIISSGSSASVFQNDTHITMKNEIAEVVFGRIGSKSSFSPINTNSLIKYVNIGTKSINPSVFGIVIDGNVATSSGTGYSKPFFEGDGLSRAGVLAHVRSSVANTEYDVRYILPASSDFLSVEVINVTGRNTSLVYTYSIGASDSIKIGNISSSSQGCYTNQNISQFFLCSHDSSSSKSSGMIWSGKDSNFVSACYGSAPSGYTFNITGKDSFNGVVPMTSADCNAVGNRVDEVSREGFPSSPFGTYELKGESKLQMKLSYDRIFINGTERLGLGNHKLCIEKTGRQGKNALVRIRLC